MKKYLIILLVILSGCSKETLEEKNKDISQENIVIEEKNENQEENKLEEDREKNEISETKKEEPEKKYK